jgi:hypothetical protein
MISLTAVAAFTAPSTPPFILALDTLLRLLALNTQSI